MQKTLLGYAHPSTTYLGAAHRYLGNKSTLFRQKRPPQYFAQNTEGGVLKIVTLIQALFSN
ncbi:MAG: hypothetical protein U5L45_02180 [Saprospiraceae bacterium]|nr:hypothetical protein [Saprospiraceae bacterium]